MRGDRRRTDAGSALLLAPAGVLVLVVLGAIAADSAVVLLAERELANAAAAAANDAATAAIDDATFYGDGRVELDAAVAVRVARAAVEARAPEGVDVSDVDVRVGAATVCVRISGTVPHWFAPAVPGARRTTAVEAASTASAAQDDEELAAPGAC